MFRGVFLILFCVAMGSCTGPSAGNPPPDNSNPACPNLPIQGSTFNLSGNITYDWVPALDNVTEGGVKLDYTAITARPVRRAIVQAAQSGCPMASTTTNDLGNFILAVPVGKSVTIQVLAQSTVTTNTTDGTVPDNCNGASWDLHVVNNVTNNSASQSDPTLRPLYKLQDSTTYTTAASGINLHAPLTYSSGYTNRAAAPFALLDTAISEIELACEGSANLTFPLLYINWSANNVASSSAVNYVGQIITSHYTTESGIGNLYILGKENVDTDEYDDHVVAHEFGHYLENKLYRADSIGGSHTSGDSLDPRVAFSEGWGNAVSAMVFNDPIYVDSSGANQASGFTIRMDTDPSGDDRGIYSEKSTQVFLWKLYDNRDGTANSGSLDRIHNILRNYQRTTPAFTTLQSFASYYNAVYGGAAESLQTLWGTTLGTPYNSLCSGTCSGSGDTADPYDSDNDIGNVYKTGGSDPRKYKQSTGSTFGAEFWRLYRTVTSGANTATAHDQTNYGGYAYTDAGNKYGNTRFYKYTATATSATFTVGSLGTSSCSTDVLDMYVYSSGTLVGWDTSTSGCPSVNISSTIGAVYIIEIDGINDASNEISSWTLTVSP